MTNSPTSTGLQENVASLLCYLAGWVSGIIFLILEPNNKTIKFHAIQSIIVFGTISIIHLVFDWIPFLGWFIIMPLAWILWVIMALVLMLTAYQGKKLKVWKAGDLAEKYSS